MVAGAVAKMALKSGAGRKMASTTASRAGGRAATGIARKGPVAAGIARKGPVAAGIAQKGPVAAGIARKGPVAAGIAQKGPGRVAKLGGRAQQAMSLMDEAQAMRSGMVAGGGLRAGPPGAPVQPAASGGSGMSWAIMGGLIFLLCSLVACGIFMFTKGSDGDEKDD